MKTGLVEKSEGLLKPEYVSMEEHEKVVEKWKSQRDYWRTNFFNLKNGQRKSSKKNKAVI